ncbi:MAG: BrnT family toxin [bacterium]
MDKKFGSFIWNNEKEISNVRKHGVDFSMATRVFKDTERKIYIDEKHSKKEKRFFCIGKVQGKILTVRFTCRRGKIRIFGAGYWRKEAEYYEKESG